MRHAAHACCVGAIAAALLTLSGCTSTDSLAIVYATHDDADAVVEVFPLSPATRAALDSLAPDDPRWQQVLAVRVGDDQANPPMLGKYEITDAGLRFTPRFPLARGMTYRAAFDPGALTGEKTGVSVSIITIPPLPQSDPTRIAAVHPSADALPENLLRIYLHFSAPMSQGDSYRHIHLRDEAGRDIELPFLELPEELWNPAGTRLTLLFDPGRVKQNLLPRREEGPVLEAGKRYTLAIDKAWKDAQGRPLAERFEKPFRVTEADVTQPDPAKWAITPPRAGSTAPLVVRFTEPLDHGMLGHALSVRRRPDSGAGAGDAIEGDIAIGDGETQWSLTPRQPWRAGEYAIIVPASLEDRAGNSVGWAFEAKADDDAPDDASRHEPVILPFRVE